MASLDQKEQKFKPSSRRARPENRRIQARHVEQHLVVVGIMAQSMDRTDEHFCDDNESQGERKVRTKHLRPKIKLFRGRLIAEAASGAEILAVAP
jgi:hypothetical protein